METVEPKFACKAFACAIQVRQPALCTALQGWAMRPHVWLAPRTTCAGATL